MTRTVISMEEWQYLVEIDRMFPAKPHPMISEARDGRVVVLQRSGVLSVPVWRAGQWEFRNVNFRDDPVE